MMRRTGGEGAWSFLGVRHGGLGSVGSHTCRFINIYSYLAMVEEFSKAGRRVGAYLNAVKPEKIECV